ncbi:hypothetical protein KKB64_03600, partial [Patescibacteria group bacterium]|nr:hypothetical protein [Patescibacteria group bacterium]MBU1472842.1 hypothetical protein [Patescibacteria group bacterium]MBU2459499.1 hypothetical protein [Patescibacteria group bacterium]MBU2543948.1 hypothetical protein [Patescibacteria group bacterium]
PTGTFVTGPSTNPGTERFVGRGIFVAGDFLLQRDLTGVAANETTSSELFLYNPQLFFTLPSSMQNVSITWKEVVP